MVRYCALDPATDTWHLAPTPARSVDAVLREAEQWLQAHDVASPLDR
jgi:hypothetical protein